MSRCLKQWQPLVIRRVLLLRHFIFFVIFHPSTWRYVDFFLPFTTKQLIIYMIRPQIGRRHKFPVADTLGCWACSFAVVEENDCARGIGKITHNRGKWCLAHNLTTSDNGKRFLVSIPRFLFLLPLEQNPLDLDNRKLPFFLSSLNFLLACSPKYPRLLSGTFRREFDRWISSGEWEVGATPS